MSSMRFIVLIGILDIGVCAPTLSFASTSQIQDAEVNQVANATADAHDFDFFVGRWSVHHRRLKERLANSHEKSCSQTFRARSARTLLTPLTDG